jgi:hypothetical protein
MRRFFHVLVIGEVFHNHVGSLCFYLRKISSAAKTTGFKINNLETFSLTQVYFVSSKIGDEYDIFIISVHEKYIGVETIATYSKIYCSAFRLFGEIEKNHENLKPE